MTTMLKTFLSGTVWEFKLSWLFIRRDFSTTLLSNSLFMLVSMIAMPPSSSTSAILLFACGLVYFWLYTYTFCLSNQISGIEEDRINKPERPLPSAVISMEAAALRWLVTSVLFLMLGAALDVLLWTLVWLAVTILHNFGRFSNHWSTKNVLGMSLGTLSALASAWIIVAPSTPLPWKLLMTICLWVGLTSSTQDFRDIRGDQARGRRTLPIAFGESRARSAMAVVWLAMGYVVHWLFTSADPHAAARLLELALILAHVIVAWRVLFGRTPEQDHTTYMIQTYIYCLLISSGIFIL